MHFVYFQAVEIEFLITWYNPNSTPHLTIPGEEAINEWRARPIKLSLWRDYTRLAWFYNPALAIFLPQRIRNAESIEDEVTRLVCADPIAVSHIPEAIKYLVTTKTLLAESHEVCIFKQICSERMVGCFRLTQLILSAARLHACLGPS